MDHESHWGRFSPQGRNPVGAHGVAGANGVTSARWVAAASGVAGAHDIDEVDGANRFAEAREVVGALGVASANVAAGVAEAARRSAVCSHRRPWAECSVMLQIAAWDSAALAHLQMHACMTQCRS